MAPICFRALSRKGIPIKPGGLLLILLLPLSAAHANEPSSGAPAPEDPPAVTSEGESRETIIVLPPPGNAEQLRAAAERDERALSIANDDLSEQKEMAKFTRLIYLVTAFGTVAGAVGLVFLGFTLYYTRVTAAAAVAQSQHNRAWIGITDPPLFTFLHSKAQLLVQTRMRSSGQSPALEVVVQMDLQERITSDSASVSCLNAVGYVDVGQSKSLDFKYQGQGVEALGSSFICQITATYLTVHGNRGRTIDMYNVKVNSVVRDEDGRPLYTEGTRFTAEPLFAHNRIS